MDIHHCYNIEYNTLSFIILVDLSTHYFPLGGVIDFSILLLFFFLGCDSVVI